MRVLVSPASKHGGTAEIGRALASTLRSHGVDVDVTQPEDIRNLDPYAAFVVGSALYMGSWLPAAELFVDEHTDGLRRRPTWLFSSGPLGPARPEEPIDADHLAHLLEASQAIEHRLFSGRLERDRLSRPERFVAHWVGATDGDYREWHQIEEWATYIAAVVKETADTAYEPIVRR